MYNIEYSTEFETWINGQSLKIRAQVLARLSLIRLHGYFGDAKKIDKHVAELRWKNGRRVYFATIQKASGSEKAILLLLAGNKNGQSKDISKARNILVRICEGQL
tara:strand:+ start:88722 stop:89036 length:315 start_codon:yes stop_codon:yes gene_type:complete